MCVGGGGVNRREIRMDSRDVLERKRAKNGERERERERVEERDDVF